MDKVLETFDWVEARAKCSAEQMFRLLVERIGSDVDTMKPRLASTGYELTANRVADDKVVVAKVQPQGGFAFKGRSVMFKRTNNGIDVDSESHREVGRKLFTASVSLWLDGRCRYAVDGQPLELWQVSQKALEDLFFG